MLPPAHSYMFFVLLYIEWNILTTCTWFVRVGLGFRCLGRIQDATDELENSRCEVRIVFCIQIIIMLQMQNEVK